MLLRLCIRPCIRNVRCYASASSSPINPTTVGPFQVFDRSVKRAQKEWAASRDNGSRSRMVDYVRDEVAERMAERFRVGDMGAAAYENWFVWKDLRSRVVRVLDLGAGAGHFTKLLDREQTENVTMMDISREQPPCRYNVT